MILETDTHTYTYYTYNRSILAQDSIDLVVFADCVDVGGAFVIANALALALALGLVFSLFLFLRSDNGVGYILTFAL